MNFTHRKRMHFSRVVIYQFRGKQEMNNEWYSQRDNKKKYPALYIYIYIYIYILLRYAAYKSIVHIYKIYYGLLTFWHRGKLRRRYFLWSPYLDSLWGSNPNPTPNPHLSNVSYLAYVRSWGSIWVSILLGLSTFLLCPSSPPWELFFLSWTWGL